MKIPISSLFPCKLVCCLILTTLNRGIPFKRVPRFFLDDRMYSSSKIRKKILTARDQLAVEERELKNEVICKRLLSFSHVQRSEVLFIYVNYRSEVGTKELISTLIKNGKKVAVPFTLEKEKKLLAVSISNIEKDLRPGYCKILEPKPERLDQHCINPECIDTIILPGSVFDRKCGRMGYGGGFYDRFIANQTPKAIRIGLCFDLQLVQELELEPHDKKMDYIITETNILKRISEGESYEENGNF